MLRCPSAYGERDEKALQTGRQTDKRATSQGAEAEAPRCAEGQSALSELRSMGAQAEFVDLDVLMEASCYRAISAPLSVLDVSIFLSITQEQAFARHRKT